MRHRYLVTAERIGREHDPLPAILDFGDVDVAPSADAIAEKLWHYVGRMLGSKDYAVSVDLGEGTFSIEMDRFGRGTIERLA